MKIKFSAVINNMSLKKDGEYRIELKVPLSDISKPMSMVKLLGSDFMVGLISEEENKAVITKAYFYKLAIDREGESKITISFSNESITDKSLGFFGRNQEKSVQILIRDDKE